MNKHSNKYQITDSNTVTFSKSCFHCGNETFFEITYKQYEDWVLNNKYVQDVFPEMNKEDREVLISGTHPKCWEEMFPIIEDDEFDDIDYDQFTDEELGFDKE